ncbi:hypothetical protein [Sporanaerobacter acetigenes]|nr:hypothetical protein [Sporanaerobacter acetigenes]
MDIKTKFNLIISDMSLAKIEEIFGIGKHSAIKLKRGESVRVESNKLIEFLNKM